jgi:hypothetical protein
MGPQPRDALDTRYQPNAANAATIAAISAAPSRKPTATPVAARRPTTSPTASSGQCQHRDSAGALKEVPRCQVGPEPDHKREQHHRGSDQDPDGEEAKQLDDQLHRSQRQEAIHRPPRVRFIPMSELRSTSERISDVVDALRRNPDAWLATASPSGRPHLVAVSTCGTGVR